MPYFLSFFDFEPKNFPLFKWKYRAWAGAGAGAGAGAEIVDKGRAKKEQEIINFGSATLDKSTVLEHFKVQRKIKSSL